LPQHLWLVASFEERYGHNDEKPAIFERNMQLFLVSGFAVMVATILPSSFKKK